MLQTHITGGPNRSVDTSIYIFSLLLSLHHSSTLWQCYRHILQGVLPGPWTPLCIYSPCYYPCIIVVHCDNVTDADYRGSHQVRGHHSVYIFSLLLSLHHSSTLWQWGRRRLQGVPPGPWTPLCIFSPCYYPDIIVVHCDNERQTQINLHLIIRHN